MIKGLLFDYDGVMTRNNNANTPPSEHLAHIINKTSEETNALFMSFWPDYLRGKITDDELWQLLEAEIGRPIPIDQRDIWSKWEQLHPLSEMVALVASLRAEGYTVGLLTNVTPTTEKEVRKGGGYEGFDFTVKSCEAGYAKPDEAIYMAALKHFNNIPQKKSSISTTVSASSCQLAL